MKINDFLICTFDGDTANPPNTYVAEITSIDPANEFFTCALVDTGREFTFQYSSNTSGPWEGTDDAGANYVITTHDIYTPQAVDPSPQTVALVTFADNKRYLCYVENTSPAIDIIFYHQPYSHLSIDVDTITKSDWGAYTVGSKITSIEGCILNSEITQPAAPSGSRTADEIVQIAAKSAIASYRWKDRGIAPAGYLKGMAMVYARVYCKLKAGDNAAIEMAKANTGDDIKDGLAWYNQQFLDAGMDNSVAGVDTLRHLFVLLIGLGMRESSGKHCEGRDMGASNTTADTAEAGLFQTSFNARSASPLLPLLFSQYANSTDFLDIFKEGVRCGSSDLENFGTGDGKEFQRLSKDCPAFAVEFTAIALRNRRKHWGPINEKTAEIRIESDAMLMEVQKAVDNFDLCPLVR
ncbi:MAG TPA: hypothetical protein VGQ53_00415 [Chitinophagaceae bacterium]|jgi:hypothetical protein|nr:hypothetical protein [Chitinophagaceae bacterium]